MYPSRTQRTGTWRPGAALIGRSLILLALAFAAAYVLQRTGDISDSLTVARHLAWPVLIAAVAAQFLSYLSSGELLRATVRQSGHTLSLSRATIIETAVSTLSLAPAGAVSSTAAVYRWTRDDGVPSYSAAAGGVLVTLFNAAALLFFGLISAGLLISQHRLTGNEALAVAIAGVCILVVIAIAILAAALPSWLIFLRLTARRMPLVRRSPWLQRADESVTQQLQVTVARLRRGRWGRAATSAALNVVFDAATLAFVFIAAGARIGTATLLAGYGLPIMLGEASLLPGGLAVTELSMGAVYISLGLKPAVVIASVVTYRLISLWLPALVGVPLIVYLQLKGQKHAAICVRARLPRAFGHVQNRKHSWDAAALVEGASGIGATLHGRHHTCRVHLQPVIARLRCCATERSNAGF